MLTAAHVMQRHVFALRPDTQVFDAIRDLLQRGFSGAPVVDRDFLVGIFSERDALTSIAAALYEDEPPGSVAQHMRRDFSVVGASTDLYEVASVFRESPIRRLPVVDCERHLLGIVSRGDVLKGLRQLYARRQKSNLDKKEHVPLKHGAS